MQTDKSPGAHEADEIIDVEEQTEEERLQWLLEMDLSEPEETLFKVDGEEYREEDLSAFEAEVAARPMFRGNAGGDDLANYVDEVIVISSDSARSDIYGNSNVTDDVEQETQQQIMAIDYSRRNARDDNARADEPALDEGTDILGLASDDDIGETFLTIKRVRGHRTIVGETSASDNAPSARPDMQALQDAPVTSRVADPAEQRVANETGEEAAPEELAAGRADGAVAEDNTGITAQEPTLADVIGDELDAGWDLEAMADESSATVSEAELDAGWNLDETVDEAVVAAPEAELDAGWNLEETVHEAVVIASEAELDAGWNLDETVDEAVVTAPGAELDAGWNLDEAVEEAVVAEPEAALEAGWDLDETVDEAVVAAPEPDLDSGWDLAETAGGAPEAEAVEATGSAEAAVFAEDIFDDLLADDFADGWQVADSSLNADIDDAFSVLGPDRVGASDDICGIDVEEFRVDERSEPSVDFSDTAPAAAVEEPAAAGQAIAANDPSDLAWCIPAHIKFSYTTVSGVEIFADFLDAFIEEGSAEVEKLEDLISEWEQDATAEEVYAGVTRTLHTLKGIGKGVGLQRFGTLIHNFETLLDALPRPDASAAPDYFRVVNVWLDAVVRAIEFVGKQRQDIASELPQAVAHGAVAPATDDPVVEEDIAQAAAPAVVEESKPAAVTQSPAAAEREKKRDQQLADEGAKALAAQQSVRITPEKLDHLLNLASQTQQLCVRASQATTRGKRSASELQGRLSSVRTHIAKIADRALLSVNARGMSSTPDMDALEMDQYSELQEAASILREGVEDLGDLIELLGRQNAQVETLLKQQSSVISSISSSIQAARVVPVSRLMPGLRRIVRTVSTDLGKVVTFKVLNEIGALDRDHYARLQVVLEHMVRNALDHGIEAPEDRLAAGKSNAGRISIDVRKSGGNYLIRLADDGRGIDPDAIRESAYNKGLDIDVDALTDEEAVRLIFHKGFSTASKLSEISGRGVGMDIVLSELQQIGGDVQIQSEVGQGTTFEVRIPSNVTVNGALLVTAAEHSYAIPLNGLIAVEQVPVGDFFDAIETGGSLRLYDMDCAPAYLATLCQGVGLPERNFWDGFVPVIVAGSDERRMAIAIDNVQEALELVVRSLGAQFAAVPGVAGAATTADGEAIVALDLNLLVDSVGETGLAPVAVHHDKDKTLLALVVDDSRTQRMVATSQLDTVGVETITAENGLVAIDLLNAAHRLPDVVLLDVEMPVKDGIETLREIRKSQRYGHLPVIMVTSRTGAKHRAMAKEAGCNAYMGKPFNFPALIEQINVLTGYDLQLS
tara:strand:- start:15577 stop:19491 length:3915 start_codon:yes stop_codon:yes gene_type:complete